MSNTQDLRELEKDPRLFLYTSLTAGSSHIITATSRLETILKANKIPFQAIDIATDEQHRRLWQRRAGKRKLPGLVKEGFVLGDLEEVEEWNEYGELKENIGPVPTTGASAAKPASTTATSSATAKPAIDTSKMVALPGAAEIKARNTPQPVASTDVTAKLESISSAPAEKEKSIQTSIKFKGDIEKQAEHLSAPPSAIPSIPASPDPAGASKEKEPAKKESTAGDTVSKVDKTASAETVDSGDVLVASKESTQSADAATSAVDADSREKSTSSADVSSVAKSEATTTSKTVPNPKETTKAVESGEIDEPSAESAPLTESTTAVREEFSKNNDTKPHITEPIATHEDGAHTPSVVSGTGVAQASKGVESLTISGDSKPQTKPAAEAAEATTSVED